MLYRKFKGTASPLLDKNESLERLPLQILGDQLLQFHKVIQLRKKSYSFGREIQEVGQYIGIRQRCGSP